jgi:hypothetical protein
MRELRDRVSKLRTSVETEVDVKCFNDGLLQSTWLLLWTLSTVQWWGPASFVREAQHSRHLSSPHFKLITETNPVSETLWFLTGNQYDGSAQSNGPVYPIGTSSDVSRADMAQGD